MIALDRYRALLPLPGPGASDVHEIRLTALDHLGVPVWCAAQWQGAHLQGGQGYGTTDDLARTSAFGEMAEHVALEAALPAMRRTRASYADLARRGMPALDPLRERLPVTTDYAPERVLDWVEARRYAPGTPGDGEPVLVPVESVAVSGADVPLGPLFTPITNGLGAGDTFARALAHGLLELAQRDGNAVSYRALDQGVVVDLDRVERPDARALLDRFEAEGIALQVKLADSSLGMANLYVVGHERRIEDAPHPIMLTGCGEAAHPDRETALVKALCEFASSRVRKRFQHGPLDGMEHLAPAYFAEARRRHAGAGGEGSGDEEPRATGAMRRWLNLSHADLFAEVAPVFADRRRVAFSSLPTVEAATPEAVLAAAYERLRAAGLDVLFVPLAAGEAGVHAVKAIVPGLEVETMTYDRIGPRNLRRLAERGADFAGSGPPPEGAFRVPLTADDEAALGGPHWFHPARAAAAVGGLYALYREPGRHVIALGG